MTVYLRGTAVTGRGGGNLLPRAARPPVLTPGIGACALAGRGTRAN
jgi:hypothetical protein